MSDNDRMIERFQRLRLRCYNVSLCNAFLILLAAAIAMVMSAEIYFRLRTYTLNFMLWILLVLWGSLILTGLTLWWYRCPQCRVGLFGDLNPNFCRKCGIKLSDRA